MAIQANDDCEWGTAEITDGGEWFTFIADSGRRCSLNAVRVSKTLPPRR